MKTPAEIMYDHLVIDGDKVTIDFGGCQAAMKEYALQWVDITQKELNETPRWDACVDRIKDWIKKQ